jgi:hypothetical protein
MEKNKNSAAFKSRAERNLSSIVTTIEFTLISVMAGVVLASLAANAKDVLHNLTYEYWPYLLFGLLYILFMWSGVIGHAFTFVGWPFDLGHNLLYIVWALVLAIQASFLQEPLVWFGLNTLQFLVAGWIGYSDLSILRQRRRGALGAAYALYDLAYQRQVRLIRLFPAAAGSALLSWIALVGARDVFIGQHLHWLLGCFQLLVAGAGLYHNARSLRIWEEAVERRAVEELREE